MIPLLPSLSAFLALAFLALPVVAQDGVYLCQHTFGSGCSTTLPTLCTLIKSNCENLILMSPRLIEITAAVTPTNNTAAPGAIAAPATYDLALFGPYPGLECRYPLLGPTKEHYNSVKGIAPGECTQLELPENRIGIDQKLEFSLQPSTCTWCANATLSPEKQLQYANRSVCIDVVGKIACDADPECIWFGSRTVGCATSRLVAFLSSSVSACGFLDSSNDCSMFFLCAWDPNVEQCQPKNDSNIANNFLSLLYFDSTSLLRNRLPGQNASRYDGICHNFSNCSFVNQDAFSGLQFNGWEYVDFPQLGDQDELLENYFYKFWIKPEASITLYPEATSGRTRASYCRLTQ